MAEPSSIGEVQARNRAGDLDYIPVDRPDASTWLERVYGMLRQGGWQDPQPGQRGTFVPGKVGDDGKVSPAVPGIIQQPAEGLHSLMTAPLGDIVRSGDRDAIRAASEASFDVASMLPAAGVAAGRTMSAATEGAAPLRTYHGRRDPNPDFDVMRNSKEVWSSTNPAVAGDYASKYGNVQGAVVPMDTTLANPMRVQPPKGTQYDAIPFDGGTYDIRQLAKMARERGHDGMIVQGVMDSPELPAPPGRVGDTVVSFQKGSVKSPLTGETIFSNADDPNTAAILAAMGSSNPYQSAISDVAAGKSARVRGALSEIDISPAAEREAAQKALEAEKAKSFSDHLQRKQSWFRQDALARTANSPLIAQLPDKDGLQVYKIDNPFKGETHYVMTTPDGKTVSSAVRVGNEVRYVSTAPEFQRQGRASALYDAIEADTGTKLQPSGEYLGPEIKAMWRKRIGPERYADLEKKGLFSNPDDPTTAAILAAMQGQDRPLPMDKASRMARAKEMGFDTDRVLYHGTGKTFDEFNPGTRGNGTARSIYLTDNPDIADIYANSKNYGLKGGGDPMIYPVLAKSEKPLVVSDKGPDGSFGWVSDNLAAALGVEHPPAGKYATLYDEARRQGYDQVQIREMTDLGGPQTQYIPLKPEYIRSVNAAFDPAKKNSANLLASNPDDITTAAILALLAQQQGGQPQQ